MSRYTSTFILFLLIFSAGCENEIVYSDPNTDTKPSEASNCMVSSAHPLATKTGLEILASGGNAFDAAVAVAAALNVVEPFMSGIGGYGTIVIYDAETKKAWFLDSSGKIPIATDSDQFRAPTPNFKENRRGAKAVSTPGNVNAWYAMSKRYGIKSWNTLFEPAKKLAGEGFKISERFAGAIESVFDKFPDNAKSIYSRNGEPLQEGEILIQNDLANSLKLIADEGPGAVYGGEIGQSIDKAMREAGGFLSIQDLIDDRAEWWEPAKINYRGYEIITASPPATAFPSLIRLGIMSRFDVGSLGHNSTEFLHIFSEVTKHAFWCRLAYAGDPEINPPPLDMLLSEEYWENQAKKINLQTAGEFEYPGVESLQGKNTTHFVVADKWGNVVSATQTLGNLFGSRIMPEGTGIWLNNSLAYCTFEPKGNPMDAHAGHRKLSGDCPTLIMKDGKPRVAIGTPGGHTIGQTVPQMVMNIIDFKMDIQNAISAPRISFFEPDSIFVENKISEPVINGLKARGHKIDIIRSLGNAHGLLIEYDSKGKPKRFYGGSDPRGNGCAMGF
ncbi:gamma-glutamyltransferase [candidate division KSB1 bacterium]